MSKLERIYDIAFELLPDGSIELQQGFAEVNRISLHACHVRHLFERAGHLLPPPPADELCERLARQLCSALLDLSSEAGLSPTVDSVIGKLIVCKEMLPDSVFPFELFPENTPDNSGCDAGRPDFQLTNPKE